MAASIWLAKLPENPLTARILSPRKHPSALLKSFPNCVDARRVFVRGVRRGVRGGFRAVMLTAAMLAGAAALVAVPLLRHVRGRDARNGVRG